VCFRFPLFVVFFCCLFFLVGICQVCEFRLVYTLAARDRLLHLLEGWQELTAARETARPDEEHEDDEGEEVPLQGEGSQGFAGGGSSGGGVGWGSGSGGAGMLAQESAAAHAPVDHLSKLFLSRSHSDQSVPERYQGSSGSSVGGSCGRGGGPVGHAPKLSDAAKAAAQAHAAAAAAASAHAAAAAATFESTIRSFCLLFTQDIALSLSLRLLLS
jgi:hypothetical protein